ncbi:hypothetical protein VXE41_18735, partial [Acinetobacter variabilis]
MSDLSQWAYNGVVVNGLVNVEDQSYFLSGSRRYSYPIASGNTNIWTVDNTNPGLCPSNNDCLYYSPRGNRIWVY